MFCSRGELRTRQPYRSLRGANSKKQNSTTRSATKTRVTQCACRRPHRDSVRRRNGHFGRRSGWKLARRRRRSCCGRNSLTRRYRTEQNRTTRRHRRRRGFEFKKTSRWREQTRGGVAPPPSATVPRPHRSAPSWRGWEEISRRRDNPLMLMGPCE